jgi:hypothetical protein
MSRIANGDASVSQYVSRNHEKVTKLVHMRCRNYCVNTDFITSGNLTPVLAGFHSLHHVKKDVMQSHIA